MTSVPTWNDWAVLYGDVAIGVTAVVLLAAVAAGVVRHALWCRTSWRLAVAAVLLLTAGRLTGVTVALGSWSRSQWNSDPVRSAAVARAEPAAEPEQWSESPNDLVPDAWRDVKPFAPGVAADEMVVEQVETAGGGVALGMARGAERGGWWPGFLWAGGSMVFIARLIVLRFLGWFVRRRRICLAGGELSARVRQLACRLGIPNARIVELPGLVGPIAFGIVRPTVAVPPGFSAEFDEDQQTVMLAHELEHLAARDPLWDFAADCVTALVWWHPLAWWCRSRLRMASEWSADDASAVIHDGPHVLAACLVQLAGRLLRNHAHTSIGIEGGGFRSSLGQRVNRLLNRNGATPFRPDWWQSSLVRMGLISAMALACLAGNAMSNVQEIKGDNMRSTLRRSWRQSLVAVALMTAFGSTPVPANAVMTDELPPGHAPEPGQEQEGERDEKVRKAQAIAEALKKIEQQMEEFEDQGNAEAVKKLHSERKELKAALEKIHGERAKIQKQEKVEIRKKIGADSVEGLHARLKQLEAENAKLRDALAKRHADGSDKEHHEMERVHRELKERFDHMRKENPERAAREMERAMHHFEIAAREKVDRGRFDEARARIKQLGAEREKALEAGKREAAEAIEGEIRRTKERVERVEEHERHEGHPGAGEARELGALLRELREDLNRLRGEVAELREVVKGGRK